ncbi:MAG: TonB-dependent receptor [Verrucomicrobia bacterium]|nr:TonB-dependent receptor [Verrucomicrobiota bacterium]
MHRKQSAALLAIFFFLFLPPARVFSVETTGIIEGTVEDSSGAVVSGVAVTVKDEQTGHVESVVTGGLGRFAFPNLAVGTYDLTAEQAGFKKSVQLGIPLRVAEDVNLLVVLQVGKVTSEVVINAPVTNVDTKDLTIGKVIETRSLTDLPLNGRNYMQLTTLVPGSVPSVGYAEPANPQIPGGVNITPQVNGGRIEANNFLLDGGDNNEPFLASAAVVPSVEAIQEFKMQTNLYTAEFGGGGGAIVNVLTKSGTNEVHGSVYEFLRNDAFDAHNFFSPTVSVLKRNQFGVSLGAPIRKNRTFVFGNYEGFLEHQAPTHDATVPTLLERQGDFSQSAVKPTDPSTGQAFPGNVIPADRLSAISQKLLPYYPAPNRGSDISSSSPLQPERTDQVLVKLDHQLTNKDDVTARYVFQHGDRTFDFVPSLLGSIDVPDFPGKDEFLFQNAGLANSFVFSPAIVNEAHFGYNRAVLHAATAQFHIDARGLGFTFPVTASFANIPLISVSGFTSIGTSNFFNTDKTNNIFVFEDNLSISRGRHLIRAGFHVGSTQVNAATLTLYSGGYLFAGAFTGSPLADFLLGDPFLFLQVGGDGTRDFRNREYTYFLQDSFAVTPHLTIFLGLRHEIFNPIFDNGLRMSTFRPGRQSVVRPTVPTDVLFPGDPGISSSTYPRDWKDLGPRVGIAWDPFSDGKTSVRVGYGIYYKPPVTFVVFQTVTAPSILNVSLLTAPSYADPFLGNSPFKSGNKVLPVGPGTQVNFLDPNLRTPYTQHYSLGIQRAIRRNYVLEVDYVGTKGTRLIGPVDVNPPVFIPGASTAANINSRRPYQPWGQLWEGCSCFSSSYNSLQASLNKHWSKGFSLLASYTYSKSIDYFSVSQFDWTSDGEPARISAANPRDVAAERGDSTFDVPHRFVASFVWELPFFKAASEVLQKNLLSGWQVNGILQVQSGRPFTVYDPSDPNIDGETSDRPNLIGNPFPSGFTRTLKEDFNTAAFQRIPEGTNEFGTAGRNILRTRRFADIDLSVFKAFDLTRSIKLEFRAESFNLFNHPNFGPPVSDITSPDFGRILNTLPANERQLQFGLRLAF